MSKHRSFVECHWLNQLHPRFQLEKDEDYVALCDINEGMSCSKWVWCIKFSWILATHACAANLCLFRVFSSPYAKGFGLVAPLLGESHPLNQSNSLFGVAFYSILLLLSMFNFRFLATIQVILLPKVVMSLLSFLIYMFWYHVIRMLHLRWSCQPVPLECPATLPIFFISYCR